MSLPVVLAAALLKIPIMVHESDIEMGMTNKMASRFAMCIATGFPVENYKIPDKELVYTGIPIEREFFDISPRTEDFDFFGFDKRKPVLLVTGGIQGAHAINMAIKEKLSELLDHWQIIHLCGEKDFDELTKMRSKLEEKKEKYAIFASLGNERISGMRIADLVISRASATTLAELSGMGKATILIPLPTAAADHQNKNAEVFETAGAALVLNEKELTPQGLYDTIESLGEDRSRLMSMVNALRQFSKPEAGKLVVEKLLQLIHE